MSRLIVVIMEENEYPFGECDNSHLQKKKVMVRKRIQFHPFQKKNMFLKAKKIKSFNHPFIIKLQQLLQEDSSLHLLFQYVPIKIQTWISNINIQFIENFKVQLLQLAEYLAQNSILIDFRLKNIGMDQNYNPKYFIGLDYQINPLSGKQELLKKYEGQINQIINPYRSILRDQIKSKEAVEPNPQFAKEKIDSSLKRQNQKSLKLVTSLKYQSGRNAEIQKYQVSQRDSIKKLSNLNEYDMKLTFDGSQKPLFENLPKNISTNIKIENIGKKINDLKNLIQNISQKNASRKHDSVSLSPMKTLTQSRPSSSYQKGIGLPKQLISNHSKNQKIQRIVNNHYGGQNQKINNKSLRQTQSQSQYSGKLPNYKGLDRGNQKKILQNSNENRGKNQVRVVGSPKQSYIYEFQKILDDDIDQFAVPQSYENKPQPTVNHVQPKSPRFGYPISTIQIQNHKTQPQRLSYPYNNNPVTKKRKKSTQSSKSNKSNASEIQQRINSVIGASRKLINNFRKSKIA